MIRRLLLTYLTLTVSVLAALAVPLGWIYQRSEQQQAFQDLDHEATVLAAYVDTDTEGDHQGRIVDMATAAARQWRGEVMLFDATGKAYFSVRSADAPQGSTTIVRAGQTSHRIERVHGVTMLIVVTSSRPGNPASGAVRLSSPLAPVQQEVHRFWTILAVASLLVLAVVVLVAVAMARWIARPVGALVQATRSLAGEDPPTLLPATTGPPELRRLTETFNTTAVRLHELLSAQRSFVDHASHQLKTPLAALRLRLENLEPDIDPQALDNLEAAIAETERLTHMVDTLLDMAQAEGTQLVAEKVDLAAVTAERVEVWTPMAAERAVLLRFAGDAHQVLALDGAVEQILDNLLSNALRVAPSGSTVAVTLRPADGGRACELHVIDHGPGLTAEQRTAALEPFWRAPGSPPGGTGLGLALVRKLVTASGGTARLDPAEPTGVDAVVTFVTGDDS